MNLRKTNIAYEKIGRQSNAWHLFGQATGVIKRMRQCRPIAGLRFFFSDWQSGTIRFDALDFLPRASGSACVPVLDYLYLSPAAARLASRLPAVCSILTPRATRSSMIVLVTDSRAPSLSGGWTPGSLNCPRARTMATAAVV